MTMDKKSTADPSYKFINDRDCTSMMRIPSQFVKSNGDIMPRNVPLRIKDSGKCWNVSVEKFGDDYFCTDGWQEFARQVDLKSYDYLSFNSWKSREVSSDNVDTTHHHESNSDVEGCCVLNGGAASGVGKMWKFTKELRKNYVYRMQIPSQFVKSNGDILPQNVPLRIKDSGKCWNVSVEKFGDDYFFTDGWQEFARQVDLKSYDYFTFKSWQSREVPPDNVDTSHRHESNSGVEEYNVLNGGEASGVGKMRKVTKLIPSQFVKSNGDILPQTVTLRIKDSGKCWNVSVEKFGDEYFFTNGWEEFAQQVDLNSWDYFTFKSWESREVSSDVDTSNHESNSGVEEYSVLNGGEASGVGKMWRFTKELKKHYVYKMPIPREFANSTGIATSTEVLLKDAEGRKWPICVDQKSYGFFFITGWHKFLIGNQVVVGTKMSFEFVPGPANVIEARVVMMGTNEKELFSCVKRKGRNYVVFESHKTTDHSKDSANSSLHLNPEKIDAGGGERLSFFKELKEQHAYRMDIPLYFIRGAGVTKNGEIMLKGGDGRKWPVTVTQRGRQFSLCGGWHNYLIGNNVMVGSTITFLLCSGNIVETEVVEGPDKQVLFESLYKRKRKTSQLLEP